MTAGFELPLLLFAGFRALIDDLHAELARRGHPDVRPAYGFAMQAIGAHGATASEVGRRLGVSKQAAGKTVDRLGELPELGDGRLHQRSRGGRRGVDGVRAEHGSSGKVVNVVVVLLPQR